jgi:hypothetical protein
VNAYRTEQRHIPVHLIVTAETHQTCILFLSRTKFTSLSPLLFASLLLLYFPFLYMFFLSFVCTPLHAGPSTAACYLHRIVTKTVFPTCYFSFLQLMVLQSSWLKSFMAFPQALLEGVGISRMMTASVHTFSCTVFFVSFHRLTPHILQSRHAVNKITDKR